MSKALDKAFEEAKAEVRKRGEQKKALTEEADQLKERLDMINEERQRATDQEDFMLYKAATDEKTKVEFELSVNEKKLKALSELPKTSDYAEVWKSFIKLYESEFKPLLSEYTERRHKLYELFLQLAEMQAKATALRSLIASACGMYEPYMVNADATEYRAIGIFSSLENQPVRNVGIRFDPNSAFFIATGEAPEAKDRFLYQTVSLRK